MWLEDKWMISVFKISVTVQPILVRQKLELVVQTKQVQPPIMNQHCMVNSCSYDLCNADHVGYTSRHLHQCDIDHKKLAITNIFWRPMEAYAILIMKINFGSYANVCKHGMRCELDQRTQSKPQHKDRSITTLRNSLFKSIMNTLICSCILSIILLSSIKHFWQP